MQTHCECREDAWAAHFSEAAGPGWRQRAHEPIASGALSTTLWERSTLLARACDCPHCAVCLRPDSRLWPNILPVPRLQQLLEGSQQVLGRALDMLAVQGRNPSHKLVAEGRAGPLTTPSRPHQSFVIAGSLDCPPGRSAHNGGGGWQRRCTPLGRQALPAGDGAAGVRRAGALPPGHLRLPRGDRHQPAHGAGAGP